MTSVRFCTSCGGTVVEGACTSCKKKVATVPGWDPAPAQPEAAPASGPPPVPTPTVAPMAPVAPPVEPVPAHWSPGYPPPAAGPRPAPARRSHGGVIALVVVVLLAAVGGGVWWWTHRPGGTAGSSTPSTSATAHPTSARPSAIAATSPKTFGKIRVAVPAGFVSVPGMSGGGAEYGNRTSKPTDYVQLSRSALPGGRKPTAYTAAQLQTLADGWRRTAVTAAAGTSCPVPVVAHPTVSAPGAAPTVDLVISCQDKKGNRVGQIQERYLIAADTLAYRVRVVGPIASWTRSGSLLAPILASVRPA